jgi:hypothetical protein
MTIPDVLRSLSETPHAFRALIVAARPEALAFRKEPDAWTAHEVLCHVTDGEVTDWPPRVAAITGGGDRRFTPFDRLGGQRKYGDWPTAAVLDEFERLRSRNLAALADLRIDDGALSRTGVHPEFGEVTLEQLLSCWVVHDLAHIAQISRGLVAYHGPAIGPWRKYFRDLR